MPPRPCRRASRSSHVAVVCALSDETRRLVDAPLIRAMQQYGADGTLCGAHLFNVARGGIVVEADAAACLQDGSVCPPRSTPPMDFHRAAPLTRRCAWPNLALTRARPPHTPARRQLATYSTDVFETEPPLPDNPLLASPNFHATPHIGAATPEAQARVGVQIASSVLAALAGDTPADGVVVRPPGR